MSANDLPINFSYAKWTPNTRFKLCNVPWDMGYRDIVKWDRQAQKEYFDGLDGIEFTDCTMAKYGLPARLPVPFAQASQYNYLIATNDYDFDTPPFVVLFCPDVRLRQRPHDAAEHPA